MSTDHATVWAALPDYLRDKLGTDASLTADDRATFRELGVELVRNSQRPYPRTYDKIPAEFAKYAADQLDAMADAIQAPGVNAAKITLDDAAHKDAAMLSDAELSTTSYAPAPDSYATPELGRRYMTELAYMVREDWAQQGTATRERSQIIRSWLADSRVVYAVSKPEKFNDKDAGADRKTAVSISGTSRSPQVVGFAQLRELADRDDSQNVAAVAIHPHEQRDCDDMLRAYEDGRLDRMYVQVWARGDMVRQWLEGHGAIDLHTGAAVEAPDQVQVAAGEVMVDEEYNGLSTGNGKSAVIQLLRAFSADGYPLAADTWLRAYFAAGGAFRHAEVVANFVREVRRLSPVETNPPIADP